MMNDMLLHPYPQGAPTGCQISIHRAPVKKKTTSNQAPRTCNKQTCYDPQLQGFFSVQQVVYQAGKTIALQIHRIYADIRILSCKGVSYGRPFLQWIIFIPYSKKSYNNVEVTYKNVQDKYNTLQNHPSQNQTVKTVNKLNCKTMTTVKTVAYMVQ